MRPSGTNIELSASDLSRFLGCRHLTALDMAVAHGSRSAPHWIDPVAVILQQRGLEHESRYAEALAREGLTLLNLAEKGEVDAVENTTHAIREGVDVLLQPALRRKHWVGRPDVLRRVDTPSGLGDWSYEVFDTKLARDTRSGTILQLALYSEILGDIQGTAPDRFHVVTPDPKNPLHSYRFQEYSAYFRLVRDRLALTVEQDPHTVATAHYPEPVEQCQVCRWWKVCDERRRQDDHLSLVAGISHLHSRELQVAGITTMTQLATLPSPLPFKPRRGATEAYLRVRDQARVQVAGRAAGMPVHELLPIVADQGLTQLPVPSAGDVFLDIEGDAFAREGGREYLFGYVIGKPDVTLQSRSLWALSDVEERTAFETLVDEILASWRVNPGMHVYHYAPYEPSALKRLMGRYATREAEIDQLLRSGRFVDLYSIVRHSVRASVESYSIKDLEPFYSFVRSVSLPAARSSLRLVEGALELNATEAITEEAHAAVEGYNLDDCLSARSLRDWLERLRTEIEDNGTSVPRPLEKSAEASEKVKEWTLRVQALMTALIGDIPSDRGLRNEEQQARWLLAHLLDWHRREDKAPWWEFFRLQELTDDELRDEKAALSGLTQITRIGGTQKCPIDRYAYPNQETDVRKGDSLHLPDGTNLGSVEAIDRTARIIDIKKNGKQAQTHPSAVFAHSMVPTETLAEALFRLGEDVLKHGFAGTAQLQAARELLLQRPPRLRTGVFQQDESENAVQFAMRIVRHLDGTVLAIQGPPGAGKTYAGARMICELVRQGARVGVTAVSHPVVLNLLLAVQEAAAELGLDVKCLRKVSTRSKDTPAIEEVTDNADAIARIRDGRALVLGGTPWLWSPPGSSEAIDVLFVDEAGQMSLANVLAASQAASSVVLLGDPQQLEQPQQGSHPEGADASALEHILQNHKTIPPDRGIFLPETWRLSPNICSFTSEAFYEGRLRSRPGLEQQQLVGTAPFEGSGLWLVQVSHEGNQNSSPEEADAVERIVATLLRDGAKWVDAEGVAHAITAEDVLIVAPYNSQVQLLNDRLGSSGIRVGTVDKFQGQEAPVLIYSMTTSSPEDAPRGMEFLYSLNRLNVATSRARCASVLVASPKLLEPECKSPRQMQLANALCRYAELAAVLDGPW